MTPNASARMASKSVLQRGKLVSTGPSMISKARKKSARSAAAHSPKNAANTLRVMPTTFLSQGITLSSTGRLPLSLKKDR